MRKFLIVVVTLLLLIVVGCGNKNETKIINNLTYEASYMIDGRMTEYPFALIVFQDVEGNEILLKDEDESLITSLLVKGEVYDVEVSVASSWFSSNFIKKIDKVN